VIVNIVLYPCCEDSSSGPSIPDGDLDMIDADLVQSSAVHQH
jgi:hypothetical protein